MQVNTLACDYCTGVRAAVKVVRLAIDGVPEKAWPRLDVCVKHLAVLTTAFKGRARTKAGVLSGHTWLPLQARLGRVEKNRKSDLVRYHAKHPPKPRTFSKEARARLRTRVDGLWATRATALLALCPNSGKTIGAAELRQKAKLDHSAFNRTIRRLE